MEQTISQCQTLDQLQLVEQRYTLNDHETVLLFERRCDIIERLLQWGRENEELGLTANVSDNWTPGERERFLAE